MRLSYYEKIADIEAEHGVFLVQDIRDSKWLLALTGYAYLIYIGWSLEMEDTGYAELLINRVALIAVMLAIVFFSGNYLDIQSKTPITKSKHMLLRLLGIAVVDAAILFVGVAIMSLVVSAIL